MKPEAGARRRWGEIVADSVAQHEYDQMAAGTEAMLLPWNPCSNHYPLDLETNFEELYAEAEG